MNEMITTIRNHRLIPWLYCIGCLMAGAGLVAFATKPVVKFPVAAALKQLSCADLSVAEESGGTGHSLDILIPAYTLARPLLNGLCRNQKLVQGKRNIVVHWQEREKILPYSIYQQQFDVMWGRGYHLAGLSPDYQHYYRLLVGLPSYDVFWFINPNIYEHEKLEAAFDAKQLRGTRIGLLNDPFSQSGYQLPLQQLAQYSIDVTSSQISFFPSRQAMVTALERGEVDMIPDTNFSQLNQENQAVRKVMLAHDVSAGGWYISRAINDDLLISSLHSYLQQLAFSHDEQ